MTTNVLEDLIARCRRQHEKPLKQKKTTSKPRLYKGLPDHFKAHCAHRYPVLLQDLEAAGISFMPIGQAPGTDRPPRSFGGERFLKRQEARDWAITQWHMSWGIHVYTGIPSARDGAPWHDIDFKYEAICAAPDTVLACVQVLTLLADGEKKTPEVTEAIRGHPKAINTELTRLVGLGDIVKVKRGVYKLPEL